MKGLFLIVLLAAGIGLLVYTGKTRDSKEASGKTYPQKVAHVMDKAEEMDLNVRINSINAALNSYYAQQNEYPESIDLLFPEYAPTQDSLNDPWGNRFKIETDTEMNLNLISPGKDGIYGTSDDIKRRI